mgnify:CR=1 FL=1
MGIISYEPSRYTIPVKISKINISETNTRFDILDGTNFPIINVEVPNEEVQKLMDKFVNNK